MQTTVQTSMAIGVPGQIVDLANSTIVAYANNSKKLDRVTVSAADTTTVVSIDGTDYTWTAGVATAAVIAATLVTTINAGGESVTLYYTAGNDYFDVESNTAGTAVPVGVATATSCVVTERIGNAAAIGYGLCVVQDEMDDDKAHAAVVTGSISTAGSALGVTVHTHTNEQQYGTAGGTGYDLEDVMSVMRKGRIYVEVEDAVTAGAQAFVRFEATSPELHGAFRSDADTADAVALPGAFFRTTTAAGGIAILEVNLPSQAL